MLPISSTEADHRFLPSSVNPKCSTNLAVLLSETLTVSASSKASTHFSLRAPKSSGHLYIDPSEFAETL